MTPVKSRQSKLPKRLPTYIIKAMWDATALKLKVEARDESEAIEKAWMKVSKMEGGMSCLDISIISKR